MLPPVSMGVTDMYVLLTYDVETVTREGRRRLRRVAKLCEGCGQRVQLSVFECSVTATQLERLIQALAKTIDPAKDSVRLYKISGRRDDMVATLGRDNYIDLDGPLIL